jgi:Domain of unknown function (DUF4328)
MDAYREPAGITRAAVIAVALYMALDLVSTIIRFFERTPGGVADMLAIGVFVVLLACLVLVGRWIYVTNANAHAFGTGEMSISPGWAIGWFFVPIANLFKPYEGVKETWQVSHNVAGLIEEAESPIVRWWWGLWIVTGIVGWVSIRLGGLSETPLEGAYYFDLLTALLNVALCLVLIRLMRRLAHAQQLARHGGVFS